MSQDLQTKQRVYAEIAIRVGLNLQPGQRLVVNAPIDAAPFVRLVAACAYDVGARLVDVLWTDDALRLIRFQHAPRDSFEEFPEWRAAGLLRSVQRGDALLAVAATDTELLHGQDPALITVEQRTEHVHTKPVLDEIVRGATNWSVVAIPIPSWAARVFPDLECEQGIGRLWELIFEVCRIDREDPVSAWKDHLAELARRAEHLNELELAELHYRGPGTDLLVGLSEAHRWISGGTRSNAGVEFVANMPTEEVFTLPHRERATGTVRASRPLSFQGTLIDEFALTFEAGRVVRATARRGEEVLRGLLETDDGSARLGEVALVPHGSPISQSGVLFFNTLFDENAASHLAVGTAYRGCLEDGERLSSDELAAAGANDSLVHVDFMVGSVELDIDGVHRDGSRVPVMRSGEWAF